MKSRTSLAFAAALALCTAAPGQNPRERGELKDVSRFQNPDLEKLQGVWLTESLTAPSGEVAPAALKDRSLTIEGNKFVRKEAGKTVMAGRLAIDTSGKQKVLVMINTDRESAQVWALYELDGDTLKVCYELLGKGRPPELKASSTQSLAVYKRQKP